MDLDWREILDKAIDIGGPIAAKVIDIEAPGAGTAIGAALPILKQQVVDKYVPGKEPPPAATPAPAPAPAPAAVPAPVAVGEISADAKTAAAFLRKQGWSHEEATAHIKGPQREEQSAPNEHARIAALVSRALDEAGWTPDEKRMLFKGPSALADLCQLRKENEPKTEAVAPKLGHVEDIIYFGKRR